MAGAGIRKRVENTLSIRQLRGAGKRIKLKNSINLAYE
jgi:hypothetical protein